MMLGLLIGFLIMGDLMNRFGRKETAIVIRCSLGIVGAGAMILSFVTLRFEFFVLGHFISGLLSALKVVLFIYLAECSPDDKRGFTSMVVNSGGVIAVLVLTPLCLPSLAGSDSLWCVLPAICGVMAIAHLMIAIHFPQSPKQLYIQEHKEEEARAALQFYYGDRYNLDDAIEEMETERIYETHKNISLNDILRHGTYRYSFFLVLICAFVPTCSALNMKLQYLVSWLTNYGMSQSQATSAMTVISVVSVPLCFVSPLFIERCGRRTVFILITVLCAAEWVALGMAELIFDFGATNLRSAQLLSVLGATMGQCAVNLGLLIMAPMMISEVCPHNTRAAISQMVETKGLPVDYIVRRIHRVYSRDSLFSSNGGQYGALIHENDSLVSMHHGLPQE
ncbi:transporter, major facilitator family protein [Teladorsagia circumcincta]|uniref:Transporter, major facilitator family protein n=1 Tax=Teladorsagia circumcincta TaxID=45464 RepID=A0A2G9UTC5_TELCI|nr:transporter, major facilitator family protein [Teladorsagia circumcincta]